MWIVRNNDKEYDVLSASIDEEYLTIRERKPVSKFQVGDHVFIREKGHRKGTGYGIVREINTSYGGSIGVEIIGYKHGRDLSVKLKTLAGWYFDPCDLEKL